jgi:hypothetical protein
MTGPAPLLDFFVLEAGEYLEQLDALLARGTGPSGPDAAAMQRLSRALRGSATMAKLGPFADVASGLERVGRGLQSGTIAWDAGSDAVVTAAVDDLKLLVRSARNWTNADTERAKARAAELQRYAPSPASSAPTPVVAGGVVFLASEATNIAAGVELLATRPDDRDAAIQVLKRVRAFRGVAGLADVPGLADVLDAVEEVVRGLERGAGPVAPAGNAVLVGATVLLRRIATEVREGKPADSEGPERQSFADAVERWFEYEVDAPVVPIAELFYGDVGPHVVTAAQHPPTSSAERFRLELVSSGEHLLGLLAAAQSGAADTQARTRRECRRALRSVAGVARSFGDRESAEWFDAAVADTGADQPLDLPELHRIANVLTDAETRGEPLVARLRRDRAGSERAVPQATAERPRMEEAPLPPRERPRMEEAPASVRERPRIERGPEPVAESLGAQQAERPQPEADPFRFLDAGIAAIAKLTEQPLAAPALIPQAEIVAIESLLYRGRGALTRAIELRDGLRRGGGSAPPETLEELFDLLDLAAAE